MADTISSTAQVSLEFSFQRGNETASRTISFDTQLASVDTKTSTRAFVDDYLENYKYGIQPTGWRDSDVEEEAWECVDIGVKRIDKTETKYEL